MHILNYIYIYIYTSSYQLKLIKMRDKLATRNHCAAPFLSRVAVNLCWYYYSNNSACRINTHQIVLSMIKVLNTVLLRSQMIAKRGRRTYRFV